jgi:hypothetical protein
MNRVFILGAGASKDAGGPLMRDFMFEGMSYLCNQDLYDEITVKSFRRVFELVDLLYGTSFIADLEQGRRERSYCIKSMHKLQDVSIEDILSFVDLGMAPGAEPGYPALDYPDYRKALHDFIFETIQLKTTHGDSYSMKADRTIDHQRNLCDMLVDYGLRISDRNSFITLNYDLLLDDAVSTNNHRLLGDYALPFTDVLHFEQYKRILRNERMPSDVDILKLHGSLNWASCTKCNQPYLAHYWPYRRLRQEERHEECPLCRAALSPILVPPTFRKDIGRYSFLTPVWRRAEEVIRQADELIVIGYSFPEADLEAKWLFRRALLGRASRVGLCLVEPDAKVREKIRAFFLDTAEISNEYESFTDYCRKTGCYRE